MDPPDTKKWTLCPIPSHLGDQQSWPPVQRRVDLSEQHQSSEGHHSFWVIDQEGSDEDLGSSNIYTIANTIHLTYCDLQGKVSVYYPNNYLHFNPMRSPQSLLVDLSQPFQSQQIY